MPSREGSPNKNKQALIALLQERYPGYQPVISMAEAAHRLEAIARSVDEGCEIPEEEKSEDTESQTPEMQRAILWEKAGNQHDKVARYVTPTLKAVEMSIKAKEIKRIILEDADASE